MERLYVLSLAYSLILAVVYGFRQLKVNSMVIVSTAFTMGFLIHMREF